MTITQYSPHHSKVIFSMNDYLLLSHHMMFAYAATQYDKSCCAHLRCIEILTHCGLLTLYSNTDLGQVSEWVSD